MDTLVTELAVVIVLATFSMIGTAVSAFVTLKSRKVLYDVNDAVNHRHEKKGVGALKMYDLLWETHARSNELIEWKRSYDDGPLDNGSKVHDFMAGLESRLQKIEDKIECDCH